MQVNHDLFVFPADGHRYSLIVPLSDQMTPEMLAKMAAAKK
jgi:hypothetical protein